MEIKIHTLGESSLLLIWENKIDDEIHEKVLQTKSILLQQFGKIILEIVPSYHSLAIYFHENFNALQYVKNIKSVIKKIEKNSQKIEKTLFHIPVCYHQNYAPDLNRVLNYHKIDLKTLIESHTSPIYKIYFLGFLPGFPYLGGLKKELHTPRKKTPSRIVYKGSVAIGGAQTGIYTTNSPGGWNVIGKSPLDFFNIKNSAPTLFKAGDFIKFYKISKAEYLNIENKVTNNNFKIKKEIINDKSY